jgi:hypothetical protein
MTLVYPTVKATTTVADVLILCSLVVNAILILAIGVVTIRKGIGTILSKLVLADAALLANQNIVYMKTKAFLLFEIVVLFCVLFTLYCYDCWVWVKIFGYRNMYYAVSYLVNTVSYVMDIQFVNLVLLLRHRFSLINSQLVTRDTIMYSKMSCYRHENNSYNNAHNLACTINSISTEELQQYSASFNYHSDHVSIVMTEHTVYTGSSHCARKHQSFYKLRVLHGLLCDVSSLVNDTYGFQILSDITTTLINITTYLYFCILYTLNLHNYKNVVISSEHMLSLHLFWLAMYLFKTVSVAVSCHAASNEANRTVVLVQKLLLLRHMDKGVVSELEAFSRQLQNRKLCFSACGFFPLNCTVLCSIAGAVTTYLVILLQFQMTL